MQVDVQGRGKKKMQTLKILGPAPAPTESTPPDFSGSRRRSLSFVWAVRCRPLILGLCSYFLCLPFPPHSPPRPLFLETTRLCLFARGMLLTAKKKRKFGAIRAQGGCGRLENKYFIFSIIFKKKKGCGGRTSCVFCKLGWGDVCRTNLAESRGKPVSDAVNLCVMGIHLFSQGLSPGTARHKPQNKTPSSSTP